MIFVDTSAIVAILARESDATDFADKIAGASKAITAGHVLLEASMRLSSLLGVEPDIARSAILDLVDEAGVEFAPIDRVVAEQAVSAFQRFGKGRGGKAKLNFGDCLSYACARVCDAKLLFKGKDFSATDILRA